MQENPLLASRNRKNESIIPLVEMFFKQLSEQFRSKIVSWAGQDIPTRIAAVEVTNMHDLLNNQEFKDAVLYAVIKVKGLPLDGCVMMQFPLFAKLLEVSIGGEGSTEFSSAVRTLTEFESQFAVRTFEHLCKQIQKSWGFGRKGVELQITAPTLNQPAFGPKSKTMEVISATMDIGPITSPYGLMSIALPSQLFERALGTSLATGVEEQTTNFDHVLDVKVDLVAELERITLSVKQLRELQVGVILPLRQQKEITLRVNGQKRFMGVFGSTGDTRSIQISDVSSSNE